MEKLERSLGGIKDLGSIPDVVFVVDIGHEKNAVREAQTLRLPIIGVVDSNHNPEGIDYVIAGNDDSIRAISYYAREIANAVLEAKASMPMPKASEKNAKQEVAVKKPVAKKTEDVTLAPDEASNAEADDDTNQPASQKVGTEAKGPIETKKPAAKKPVETKKPAAKKPVETKKPAAKKPAAKKPAAKKPAAKKPAAKKPAAKKPAAKKADT
jgi:small subunit ribosomal protein S2